jgi:hypothetical protein
VMLTLPSSVRVYLAAEPVDLRRGHDGLVAIVRTAWRLDPFGGHLFVFLGRRLDRVKILVWDVAGAMLHVPQAIANARRSHCRFTRSVAATSRSFASSAEPSVLQVFGTLICVSTAACSAFPSNGLTSRCRLRLRRSRD